MKSSKKKAGNGRVPSRQRARPLTYLCFTATIISGLIVLHTHAAHSQDAPSMMQLLLLWPAEQSVVLSVALLSFGSVASSALTHPVLMNHMEAVQY